MVCNKSLFSSATPETFYEILSAWVADNDSIERHLISYYLYLQQQISDVYFKAFEDRVRNEHLTRALYLTSCCSIKKHLIRTFSFWPFFVSTQQGRGRNARNRVEDRESEKDGERGGGRRRLFQCGLGELFGVKICLNGCWGSIYYRQEAEGGFSSHLM